MDHPDGPGWSGSQEDLSPPSRCSGEILNRAPGNNSTLDFFFLLPRFLGSILTGVPTVHNPPTQHHWAGTIP